MNTSSDSTQSIRLGRLISRTLGGNHTNKITTESTEAHMATTVHKCLSANVSPTRLKTIIAKHNALLHKKA